MITIPPAIAARFDQFLIPKARPRTVFLLFTAGLHSFGSTGVEGNAGFINPVNGSLRLATAPALNLGLKPIPHDKISPFVDEWRTSLPSRRLPERERQ